MQQVARKHQKQIRLRIDHGHALFTRQRLAAKGSDRTLQNKCAIMLAALMVRVGIPIDPVNGRKVCRLHMRRHKVAFELNQLPSSYGCDINAKSLGCYRFDSGENFCKCWVHEFE